MIIIIIINFFLLVFTVLCQRKKNNAYCLVLSKSSCLTCFEPLHSVCMNDSVYNNSILLFCLFSPLLCFY